MTLPQISLPKYRHFLTGLNKEIEFRPFTVKEQKIMLMAKQADSKEQMVTGLIQILSLCTFNTIDIAKLPLFDVIDLLIRIRSKSVDNIAKHAYKYKYKKTLDDGSVEEKEETLVINLNLDDVKVVTNPEHKLVIMLDDTIGIKMKYPTLQDVEGNGSNADDFAQIARNIDVIFNGDDVYSSTELKLEELIEYVDSFSSNNLKDIKDFYETMPKISHSITVKLKDGTTETMRYETLEDFFN